MYPVISMEEVSSLERIQLSDKEEMDIFYKSNTCFLLSVLKQHLDKGLAFEKLVDAGKKRLEQACERFDLTVDLSSYSIQCGLQKSIENPIK